MFHKICKSKSVPYVIAKVHYKALIHIIAIYTLRDNSVIKVRRVSEFKLEYTECPSINILNNTTKDDQ